MQVGGGLRLIEQVTTNLEADVQLLQGREFVTLRGRAILDAIPCFEREHIARARALDPLNAWAIAIESTCQMLIGLVAESVHTAERAIDLDDKNWPSGSLPAFKPIWKDEQCSALIRATSLFASQQ